MVTRAEILSDAELERLARSEVESETTQRLLATIDALKKDAFVGVRNDEGVVVSKYYDKISDLRSQLSGWHFSQESLTTFERKMLYVGEQLMGILDSVAGGYLR